MNFLYILTLFMVISSASNGEIYQNGTVADFCPLNFTSSNFTSATYHLSVPLPIRMAFTFVLILMLMAAYCLETMLLTEHFDYVDDITGVYLVKMMIYHSFAVCLAFWFAPDQLEFGILISYGIYVTAGNYYFDVHRMYIRIYIILLPPDHFVFRMIFHGIFVICAIVIIGVHFLLSYMTVMSVYKENFSAFIPLGISVAIGYIGANRISNPFGQILWNIAMTSLMLFVNVKLLATLSSALNEGKSIWPLTTTVIMAILLIFTLRYFIISLVCKYPRGQHLFNIYVYWNFPAPFQLAFTCVLGYLTALVYSLFTH